MYNKINMENILTGELLKHYNLANDVINEIFATITTAENIEELKENFEITTTKYAYELDNQGYEKESNLFIATCAKISCILDTPDILIKNKKFFTDLFQRLDYLIYIKAKKPKLYEEEYKDFFDFFIKQSCYFGREMYVPKHPYDEEALSKIITPIVCKRKNKKV